MNGQYWIIILMTMFSNGCFNRSLRSVVPLKCNLYAENYNVNSFGVDEVYLTDSLNFRLLVGKCDIEHERFSFDCRADTIIVYKKGKDAEGKWRFKDICYLSREYLVKNKVDSTVALFEFK